jgi:hypothetical protein
MTYKHWIFVIGLLIGAFITIRGVVRFTRNVPPYMSTDLLKTSPLGSMDSTTASKLQTILNKDVNRLKTPGLQVYIRLTISETRR